MEETAVLDAPELEVGEVEEVEQPDESTDLGEATTEEPEGEESTEETDEPEEEVEEGTTEASADGRKMPDSIKKGIAAIKATNPEAAKEIKGLFFANQEYRAVFPKPADAVAAKQFLDEIGGQDGVKEIAAEREEWQQIDRDFSDGKPEFVKGLAEGNPEAFLKTAPHVINEFATRAPEQYNYYANRLTLNTMANAGISMHNLRGAYDKYSAIDRETGKMVNADAAAVLAEIYNSMHDMNQAATVHEQKRTDPREEQLKQRETQFETQRRADFEVRTADEAKKFAYEKMQPEIDAVVGNRKVDKEAMDGYRDMVKEKLDSLFEAIPGISDKLEALYRAGDAQKAREYIQGHYTRLMPQAAKAIEKFVRNIPASGAPVAKPKPNGTPAQRTDPGSVVLKEMPSWDQLDPSWRSRPEATAELMQGTAILRSGKKASGWA